MPTQIELVRELTEESKDWYEKYPWFSLGQLINASDKKHQDDFKLAASTSAIFFNDVQRFHWLLHEAPFNKNIILSGLNIPISTEGMQTTPQPFPKKEQPQIIIPPKQLIAVADVEEKDATNFTTFSKEEHDNVAEDIIIHEEVKDLDNEISKPPIDENEPIEIEKFQASNVYVQQPEEAKPNNEFTEQPEENNETTIIGDEKKDSDNIDEDKIAQQELILTSNEAENETKAQQNIKAVLNAGDAMDLTFEPYHTVDYFASQGIKVDTKIDDRLGKQLKSFTSWLKSMKRLPTNNDVMANAQIVAIQDKSLENTNVITEAMAAVLVKQGKKEQAIEIFRQLSLIHPEKSRYFAAQIEQLKN